MLSNGGEMIATQTMSPAQINMIQLHSHVHLATTVMSSVTCLTDNEKD